jgi:hypothetical protein
MTNDSESIAKTENELLELLKSGTRRIVYTGPVGSVPNAIDFAIQNGYTWFRERFNDPTDPDVSLLETCFFTKVTRNSK